MTLEGIELEATYDARFWFFGFAAHSINGKFDDSSPLTASALLPVPARQLTLTAGIRALDSKLIAGTRVQFVDEQIKVPPPAFPGAPTLAADGYTLVDLFGQYAFSDDFIVNVNIDNLFDKNYRPFLDQSNSPGLNARFGVTMRFGGGGAAGH